MNNCLIDSLLLALTAANLTPNAARYSKAERKRMCARCREHLRRQYGTPVGTYLDGHADAPHILDFLLRHEWRKDVSVRVHFYDCLDAGQVLENQDELAFVDYTVGTKLIYDRIHVHVYNHTTPSGRGYHFDVLIPQQSSAAPIEEAASHARSRSPARQTSSSSTVAAGPLEYSSSQSHSVAPGGAWETRQELAHRNSSSEDPPSAPLNQPNNDADRPPAEGMSVSSDPLPTPRRRRGSGQTTAPDATVRPSSPTAVGTRGHVDPWPTPATPSHSGSEVGAADTDSVLSWDSHQSSDGSSAAPSLSEENHLHWRTLEDAEAMAIRDLGQQFRTKPLLPPPLPAEMTDLANSMSGIALPACHCSFENCGWRSEAQPCVDALLPPNAWVVDGLKWHCSSGQCCADSESCLWAHLQAHHATAFEHCPGDIPSAYVAALQHVEEQAVPAVGWSVDRRTLRRLRQARQEDHCVALICSCCAAVLPSGPRSDIGYLSIDNIFSGITTKSFQENWDLKQYKTTYGLHASIRERLSGPEWQRRLPEHLFQGASILCCPEDRRCSRCPCDSTHSAGQPERRSCRVQDPDPYQFCNACELPVRRSCWCRMRQKLSTGIPQALTNDNWYGYPVDLLYTHKVRWVEAAAACPVWTSMISFYLEADRGHVMEETLHRADQRLAIRGNVSAVSLPWEQIYGKFADMTPEHRLATLPHALPALRSMIHLTVKGMLHGEISDWVAGARVRPWVVVAC